MEQNTDTKFERKMNRILVTGGSGFLGRHLIKNLLNKYDDARIRTISRGENDIATMLTMCHNDRLEYVIGDIRDIDTLKHALIEIDTVIHLAAMKHVDFSELYPTESITINVIGTINLLKLFKGQTFIAMSTDKAVEATGCYGATKLLLEKLVLNKAREAKHERFMVIRSGNIFGSSGSVIQKWSQQIRENNEITVTDLEMTRFFIDVNTLADFIINIMEDGVNGKLYIPSQKAIKLETLAQAIVKLIGDEDTKIKVRGLRTGEKLHEKLLANGENSNTGFTDAWSNSAQKLEMEEIKKLLKDSLRV